MAGNTPRRRVREFEQANTIPAALERRVEAYLKKVRKKR